MKKLSVEEKTVCLAFLPERVWTGKMSHFVSRIVITCGRSKLYIFLISGRKDNISCIYSISQLELRRIQSFFSLCLTGNANSYYLSSVTVGITDIKFNVFEFIQPSTLAREKPSKRKFIYFGLYC